MGAASLGVPEDFYRALEVPDGVKFFSMNVKPAKEEFVLSLSDISHLINRDLAERQRDLIQFCELATNQNMFFKWALLGVTSSPRQDMCVYRRLFCSVPSAGVT